MEQSGRVREQRSGSGELVGGPVDSGFDIFEPVPGTDVVYHISQRVPVAVVVPAPPPPIQTMSSVNRRLSALEEHAVLPT